MTSLTERIEDIGGITQDDIVKLRRQKIETVDSILLAIGSNFRVGIADLAQRSGVSEATLRYILLKSAEGNGTRTAANRSLPALIGGYLQWLLRWNWLSVTFIAVCGMLLTLLLRAVGGLPPQFGMCDSVVVLKRDLAKGKTLRAEDLQPARLSGGESYFQQADLPLLPGLVLAQDVPQGHPLRYDDVLRPQVVATRDLRASIPIPADALTVQWTTFQRNAATAPGQVIGCNAQSGLHRDQVVLLDFARPSAVVNQVCVVAPQGLPAFYKIQPRDVALKPGAAQVGAFTNLSDVLGQYTAQPVARDQTLLAGNLRPVALSAEQAKTCQVWQVPFRGQEEALNAVLPSLESPARIWLRFVPRAAQPAGRGVRLYSALLLGVQSQPPPLALVLALDNQSLADLKSLWQTSTVSILPNAANALAAQTGALALGDFAVKVGTASPAGGGKTPARRRVGRKQ